MLPDLLSMFLPKKGNQPVGRWDETLPDGRSVYEAVAEVTKQGNGGFFPQGQHAPAREPYTGIDGGWSNVEGGKSVSDVTREALAAPEPDDKFFPQAAPHEQDDRALLDPAVKPAIKDDKFYPQPAAHEQDDRAMPPAPTMPVDDKIVPQVAPVGTETETAQQKLDKEREKLKVLETDGAEKKPTKLWKRILRGVLQGAAAGGANGGGIGGMIGGAAAGAGSGFFPSVDRARRTQEEIGKTKRRIDTMETQRTRDIQAQNSESLIRDREEDRRIREDKYKSDREVKVSAAKDRKRTAFYKKFPYFDSTKATPAQIREMAEFGETPESVGTYNYRKENIREISGLTFEYDPITKTFRDTGAPIQPGEQAVQVDMLNPVTDKVERFVVSADKAAQLYASQNAAKLSQEGQDRRQASQLDYNRQRDSIRSQIQVYITQYNALKAEQKMKEAEAAKYRLMELQQQLEAIPQY